MWFQKSGFYCIMINAFVLLFTDTENKNYTEIKIIEFK